MKVEAEAICAIMKCLLVVVLVGGAILLLLYCVSCTHSALYFASPFALYCNTCTSLLPPPLSCPPFKPRSMSLFFFLECARPTRNVGDDHHTANSANDKLSTSSLHRDYQNPLSCLSSSGLASISHLPSPAV